MIKNIDIISTFCNPWPKDNPIRYYVKSWENKFKKELSEYYYSHNISSDDNKNHIHVFFDKNGVLQITQCDDQKLIYDIECYVENRYKWELNHNDQIRHAWYSVSSMLTPFISQIKNGFYQIRYKDTVINISPEQYKKIETLHAECIRTPSSTIIIIKSNIPRLDELISSMINNEDIYPFTKLNY